MAIPTEIERHGRKYILLNKRYRIYYSFFNQDTSNSEKNAFFLHVIIDDIVRILTIPMFFQAREKALKIVLESNPELKTPDSILNLIYELTHPLKFVLDSGMIKIDDAWTGSLKNKYDIQFGNVAIVIPEDLEKTKDNIDSVGHLSQTYPSSRIVQTYEQALEALKVMNDRKFKK